MSQQSSQAESPHEEAAREHESPEHLAQEAVGEIDGNTDVQMVEEVEEAEEEEEDDDEDQAQMVLPLSKIKKIFKMDPDYAGSSQSAVYATGLATELFIQYLVEQASLLAKTDKRKKIVYKDFSNAVSTHDTLNFLSDTIPKTQPIGELVSQKKVILNTDKQLHQHHPPPEINDIQEIIVEEGVEGTTDIHSPQKKTPGSKKKLGAPLPKGQQTLSFSKPVRKAIIGDLVTSDVVAEDTVMMD